MFFKRQELKVFLECYIGNCRNIENTRVNRNAYGKQILEKHRNIVGMGVWMDVEKHKSNQRVN